MTNLSNKQLIAEVESFYLSDLEEELIKRLKASFLTDAQAYLLNQAAENGINTIDKVEALFALYEASNRGFDRNLAAVLELAHR